MQQVVRIQFGHLLPAGVARAAVLASTLALSAVGLADQHDIGLLLDGVAEVGAPGVPGPLCVYGPDAFPVVAGALHGTRAPVAAAARWQDGRVVALGHADYLGRDTIGTADTGLFLGNALRWAASGNASPRIGVAWTRAGTSKLRDWLVAAGYNAVEVALTPDALASVDVVVLEMWNQTGPELESLGAYVRAGGGLVSASTGWGWARLHPQLDLVNDFPGNRLLAEAGIQWFYHQPITRTSPVGYAVEGAPDPLTHAQAALDAVQAHEAGQRTMSLTEIAQVLATLDRAARCVPPDDSLFAPRLRVLVESAESRERWPTADNPVGKDEVYDRLASAAYVVEHGRTAAESVRAHPASADFPGSVPDDAPRVSRRLTIDTNVPRWHSTGLYAAPGEAVTVTVPAPAAQSGALHVRVGAHTDGLWPRDEWTRMPEISRRFPVSAPYTFVANAFGGLIYVEVARDADLGPVPVEIEGAVAAPRFVLGETDPVEWRNEIRDAPAPWGEIEAKNMIVTTESDELRALDDPTDVAKTWDRVLDLSAELAAWTSPRSSPERFVVDRQISHGWMHAGYPLMAHMERNQSAYLVDAQHISTCRQEWTQSNWGFFHEVGHNHQSPDWVFEGSLEVSVNLFVLYVYEFLCGIPVARNGRGSPAFRTEQMTRYDFDNPDFELWKHDLDLALVMYEQLQQAFGWEAYRQVFAEYRDLPDAERPKSDEEKRDQWLVRFSRTVGRNLGPFFEAWGVPTSQAARDEVAGLAVWLPDGFPPGTVEAEGADADGDGVADALDPFPLDPTETADADGDGIGDNADAFPLDPAESADSDADGTGDNADAFPDDPDEWLDTDADGVGDNADRFPDDPAEWVDTDGDGRGDNADPDADGDGVNDTEDIYPLDASRANLASWVLLGEAPGDAVGTSLAGVPDLNGDGLPELLVGSPHNDAGERIDAGAVWLISAADLPWMDARDGRSDRVVNLGFAAGAPGSWKITGRMLWDNLGTGLAAGDIDGDGRPEILIGAPRNNGAVYILEAADLESMDAGDGAADGVIDLGSADIGAASWKIAHDRWSHFGSAISVGDADGDGLDDLLIGAHYEALNETPYAGAAYYLPARSLAEADAGDGSLDRTIALSSAVAGGTAVQFAGLAGRAESVGRAVSLAGDFNGDGRNDLAIGAPDRQVEGWDAAGAVQIVDATELGAADALDGAADGVVELARVHELPGSWQILGEVDNHNVGLDLAAGFMHRGSPASLAIGTNRGINTYILAGDDMTAADARDGAEDGRISTAAIRSQPRSWDIVGLSRIWADRRASAFGDFDADGLEDLLVGADRAHGIGGAFVLGARKLQAHRDAGTSPSRRLDLRSWSEPDAPAWMLAGPALRDRAGASVSLAGDIDGDGAPDMAVGAPGDDRAGEDAGAVYLVLAADMEGLDGVDGLSDRRLSLANLAGDTDKDGVGNALDPDDDNDGVADSDDDFQLDPAEWKDTDGDGAGDNEDAFPGDSREQLDTDGDGVGDNADGDNDGDGVPDGEDNFPLDTDDDGADNRDDPDDDGDGVPDTEDDLPLDPTETVDTDGDGIGDNADNDDDNDEVPDAEDGLPLDPTETVDTDGDGVGDNADAFPNDPGEHADADGDGTGDNADTDDDNDGVPDTEDAFAFDPTASADADGDGVPDPTDAFPEDAAESVDTDGDGVGDNADRDDDGDGVADSQDLFPLNPARWSLTSIKFVPESARDRLGAGLGSAGDLDGDARAELLLGAPEHDSHGTVYVVSSRDLARTDEADGVRDGIVAVRHVAPQLNSWKLAGEEGLSAGAALASAGDLNGDSVPEFLVGATAAVGALYAVSAPDLLGADAADGVADGVVALDAVAAGAASWRLAGDWGGGAGGSIAAGPIASSPAGHILVGQPGGRSGDAPGTAHLIQGSDLSALDAADGAVDGRLGLGNHVGPWLFTGENSRDRAGLALASGDFDGDGLADVAVGAPSHDSAAVNDGAVYLVGSRDFGTAHSFELAGAAGAAHSFKIVGEAGYHRLGSSVAAGDMDGDGREDLAIASDNRSGGTLVHILSGGRENLLRLDEADGRRDGVLRLAGLTAAQSGTWRLTHPHWMPWEARIALADVDGDARADLLVPLWDSSGRGNFRLLPGAAITADGHAGGDVRMEDVARTAGYAFDPGVDSAWPDLSAAGAGDVDGDGREDILLGVASPDVSAAWLIVAADLELLDAGDGTVDRQIHLDGVEGPRRR